MTDVEYEKKWGKGPHVAVDIVVYDPHWLKILLIRREFTSEWALPGGFVEPGELISNAAYRELREETSYVGASLKFLFHEDDPHRDPRSHIITFVHYTERNSGISHPIAGSDAAEVKWFDILNLPEQMFADHRRIIRRVILNK